MGVGHHVRLARLVAATTTPVAVYALLAGSLGAFALVAALATALLTAAWLLRGLAEERRESETRSGAAAREEQTDAEAQRDRLASLIAELGDAIVILDSSDRVRLANPAAERILSAVPLVGRRAIDVIRDHEMLDVLRRAARGAEATGQVERVQPQRLLRVVARPLPGGELLLTIQDLSELRRLETVRADFVANVSHELRTPLASVRAMAETLAAGALDDRAAARDFLSRMVEEVDGLTRLVEELLSLTRIESGADRLALDDLDPGRTLREAAHRLTPLAARAGVSVEVHAEEGLPPVRADGGKIGQVLANLLHNAVKFTPAGGRVTLSAEAREGDIAFIVSDTGSGMDRVELDRVFERFYKGDRSRATGGTGLGLAIVKHIVQAHGGEVWARSDGPGRGATFGFTLPRAGGG